MVKHYFFSLIQGIYIFYIFLIDSKKIYKYNNYIIIVINRS